MDAAEDVDAVSWAFSAQPKDGVPVLEALAGKYASSDSIDLSRDINVRTVDFGSAVDARELMSILVSGAPPFASPAQLSLYVVIISRVFVRLFIETVARRQRLMESESDGNSTESSGARAPPIASEAVVEAARVTMRSWSRDVTSLLLTAILPHLCLRDAEAHTISTSQPIDSASTLSHPQCTEGKQALSDDDTTGERELQLQRAVEAFREYGIPASLVRLTSALYASTQDEAVGSFALAVYATLHQLESFPPLDKGMTSPVVPACGVLWRWRQRFSREVDATPTSYTDAQRRNVVDEGHDGGLATAVTDLRRFLRTIAARCPGNERGALWPLAVSHLSAATFPATSESTLFATELERGAAPPDTAAGHLAHDRATEMAECTLIAIDNVDDVPAIAGVEGGGAVFSSGSLLTRQGALFLIADVLRGGPFEEGPLYTISSASLLLSVLEVYEAALATASCAALMRHLLFLHDLLATTSKYSIACVGEYSQLPSKGNDAAVAAQERSAGSGFDECLSRRYEVVFAVAKELLSVSALCPSDEHRRAARVIALELLERLQEEPRVRMHLSLLTLCPYASIARFFLERLLQDWREQHPLDATSTGAAAYAASTSPLACLLPAGLAACVSSFAEHVWSATREFLDPLIVVLNFVRVELSRRPWLRAIAQSKTKRAACERGSSTAAEAWSGLLEKLRREALPRCEKLADASSSSPPSTFAMPSLSPLDAFSLSCAVDGLKAVL